LAGDFNEDTFVNVVDLTSWKTGFGQTGNATHHQGDAEGDRDVDGADFLLWQRQVGMTGTATLPVPEPSAFAMAIAGGTLLAVRGRRRFGLSSRRGAA
jgi:hypothetical protein